MLVLVCMKSKIEKALQGWSERLFSAGGKEILLKAVVQVIPTYSMSCFKIPKGLCDEINKKCARFWWGSFKNHKKIHWAKWKTLCKSKDFGGMGFWDISLFNQVMLAKQSWRIIRNPNSLLHKVLRGRYFRDGDFFNAPEGNNSSLVWKSIVWGRTLFKEGYSWRIGNGSYISIDHDPRIIRDGKRVPIITPDALKNRKVSSLIKDDGNWDDELIKRSFISMDNDDIINIPLGN